jgi:hypothetical protein
MNILLKTNTIQSSAISLLDILPLNGHLFPFGVFKFIYYRQRIWREFIPVMPVNRDDCKARKLHRTFLTS